MRPNRSGQWCYGRICPLTFLNVHSSGQAQSEIRVYFSYGCLWKPQIHFAMIIHIHHTHLPLQLLLLHTQCTHIGRERSILLTHSSCIKASICLFQENHRYTFFLFHCKASFNFGMVIVCFGGATKERYSHLRTADLL